MSSKDDIRSIANELKTMLLNIKKKMKEKDESLKKVKSIHEMTKKEYQTLFDEHAKMKKRQQQYEKYFKLQQIQKQERREMTLKKKRESLNSKRKKKCLF